VADGAIDGEIAGSGKHSRRTRRAKPWNTFLQHCIGSVDRQTFTAAARAASRMRTLGPKIWARAEKCSILSEMAHEADCVPCLWSEFGLQICQWRL